MKNLSSGENIVKVLLKSRLISRLKQHANAMWKASEKKSEELSTTRRKKREKGSFSCGTCFVCGADVKKFIL